MNTIEVASLSSKGQIVIPNIIRNQLHLNTGTKLMIMTDGSNILLKPIETPQIDEFNDLILKSRKFQSSKKLKKTDIRKAITKVRHDSGN